MQRAAAAAAKVADFLVLVAVRPEKPRCPSEVMRSGRLTATFLPTNAIMARSLGSSGDACAPAIDRRHRRRIEHLLRQTRGRAKRADGASERAGSRSVASS